MTSLVAICQMLGHRALERLRLWRSKDRPNDVRSTGDCATSVLDRACTVRTLEEAQPEMPPEWAPVARSVKRDPLRVIRRLAPLLAEGVEGATVATAGAQGSRQLHFVRFGPRRQR